MALTQYECYAKPNAYIDRYDNFHWFHFVNYINEIVRARIKAQFVLDINLHLHSIQIALEAKVSFWSEWRSVTWSYAHYSFLCEYVFVFQSIRKRSKVLECFDKSLFDLKQSVLFSINCFMLLWLLLFVRWFFSIAFFTQSINQCSSLYRSAAHVCSFMRYDDSILTHIFFRKTVLKSCQHSIA